jgi:hypothetical protein
MIVWGGSNGGPSLGTGGVYDPATDTWTPTSITGAPTGRWSHTAVWTGAKMIVWGGAGDQYAHMDTGAIYDPATDTWSAMSTTGGPARYGHLAVWTGTEMIVWGGNDCVSVPGWCLATSTGGIYDPATDMWRTMSTTGAPGPGYGQAALWTGDRMFVWGRRDGIRGAAYDPATDTWTPTSPFLFPTYCCGLTAAVWTGTTMILWNPSPYGGGIYDPATDTWATITATGAATGRNGELAAVWTGTKMITWGGELIVVGPNTVLTDTGGIYDPAVDSWTATRTPGAPTPRSGNTAIWTGTRMIVWGGSDGHYTNTGGVFLPEGTAPRLDASGEGFDDIVLRQDGGNLDVLCSDGSSLASTAWGGGLPSSLYDVYYADVTGDGRADVVSRHRTTGDVEVRASTGVDFTWTPGSGPGGVWSYGWTTSYDLLFADVTGDGKADLVGRSRSTGDVYVLPSSGEGFDSEGATLWSYGWRPPEYDVYLADVTGDLKADLVARYVGRPAAGVETGDVFVAESSGTAFLTPVRWTYGFSAGYEISVADADGDGRADLVGRYVGPVLPLGSGGDVWVMHSTGSRFAWYGMAQRWSYGWGAAYDVVLRDVTGDGRADLVGRLRHNAELYVAPSDGTRFSFVGAWATGIDASWQVR